MKRIMVLLLLAGLICFVACGDDDKATDTDTGPAIVNGTLTLPADATGKAMYVIIDNDDDGGNGWLYDVSGPCGSGTSISYSIDSVDAGTYFLYATVYAVGDSSGAPGTGDYFGYYLTGATAPAQANAVVPATGTLTADITLGEIPPTQ